MLSSFVIELETLEAIVLNGYGGEAIHGLFFEVLNNYSKKVAEYLHNGSNRQKPFSLSGILEKKPKTEGKIILESGEKASFRISILEEKLLPDTLAAFGKALNLKTSLTLGNGKILLKNIHYKEGQNLWVRSSLYPKLFEEAQPDDKIQFKFFSPTSFRIRGNQCTLPGAYLIFGSLIDRWNSFSGITFDKSFTEKLHTIYPSQFKLKSEIVNFSNYKVIGFKGVLEYRLGKEFARKEKKILNTLADFAFYSGIGYKTTMGMGQAVRVKQ